MLLAKVFKEINTWSRKWPALPLFATGIMTLIAVSFVTSSTALAMTVMVFVMGLQVILGVYDALYDKLLPIEWVAAGEHVSRPGPYQKASPWLAFLPLLVAIYAPLGWLALLGIVIGLMPAGWRLLMRMKNRHAAVVWQIDKVAAYQPLVAVHLSGSEGVVYQINQWLPVLEALDVSVIVLVRERSIVNNIGSSAIPKVYARNAVHIEKILRQGVQTVLYPANPMKNLQLLRHHRLKHFFINHGESDKDVNQSKLLMAYDKLLVGGPHAEQRLRDAGLPVREDQVVHVGRPQADMLLHKAEPDAGLRTLLYAPTWEGFVEEANYSSIGPLALTVFEQLANRGYRILFKPHPYTGVRDKPKRVWLGRINALCERDGHEFIDPAVPIHDCMNRSDAMITDISSVITDYLVTDKPIILCLNERLMSKNLIDEFHSAAAAYHFSDSGPAMPTLLQQIEDGDPLAAQRDSVRADILGHFEESALARFKKVVESSVVNESG